MKSFGCDPQKLDRNAKENARTKNYRSLLIKWLCVLLSALQQREMLRVRESMNNEKTLTG